MKERQQQSHTIKLCTLRRNFNSMYLITLKPHGVEVNQQNCMTVNPTKLEKK